MNSIGVLVHCSGAVSVPVRSCLQNLFTGRRGDHVAEAFPPRKDEFWRLGAGQRKLERYNNIIS